jgi:CheY-like chemotaxis protein
VGLQIESQDTGIKGVERAKALCPDLILIDIQLPDITGFEVLERLRAQEETKHTHCIALSANALPEDIARALAAGFNDYWTKPIDFAPFMAAMNRLFPRLDAE